MQFHGGKKEKKLDLILPWLVVFGFFTVSVLNRLLTNVHEVPNQQQGLIEISR